MPHQMTPEEQAQFNADVRNQQIKNKQQLDELMARNYGDQPPVQQTPVQQTVESGFQFPQQISAGQKKVRDIATLTRLVKMELRNRRMNPDDEKLIKQGVEQLQTSCKLKGIVTDTMVEACIKDLKFSQNGARRRNRTKHRRSRHKRTRRYRKN